MLNYIIFKFHESLACYLYAIFDCIIGTHQQQTFEISMLFLFLIYMSFKFILFDFDIKNWLK